MANPIHSEILIVGSGIFGTSTAYHLSLTHPDPSKITVLDRALFPSPKAASSDVNKIVRADYGVPFYMSLAYEAMDAWATWPIFKDVYHRSGWVMLDDSPDLAERIRQNFKESGREDPTEDVDVEEVKRRWGGVLKGMDTEGFRTPYVNPSAGWCDASKALEKVMKEAVGRGVRYQVGEVDGLVLLKDGHGVRGVKTKDGVVYTADKVMLATGAWTSMLMSSVEDSLDIEDGMRTEEQVTAASFCVALFRLGKEDAEYYRQMPVLVYGSKGEVFPPNGEGVWKFTNAGATTNYITTKSGHRITVPPDRNQTIVPAKLQQESVDIIRSRIPQILERGRRPDSYRLCWDAITPDQNQLLTRHPDPRLSNLFFAVDGSGHSWKFLPTIGKYMVKVLNGESNGEEMDDRWKWKTDKEAMAKGRGAHEKAIPQRELKDLESHEDVHGRSKL